MPSPVAMSWPSGENAKLKMAFSPLRVDWHTKLPVDPSLLKIFTLYLLFQRSLHAAESLLPHGDQSMLRTRPSTLNADSHAPVSVFQSWMLLPLEQLARTFFVGWNATPFT